MCFSRFLTASFSWLLCVCWLGAADDLSVRDERTPFTAAEMARGYRQGRVLVKARELPTLTETQRETALVNAESAVGVTARRTFRRLTRQRVLEIDAGTSVAETIARLRASGLYEFVEPDYLRSVQAVPNDTRFAEQWSLNNTGQASGTPDADIDAPEGWDLQTDASTVIVAVIDSGLRVTHEDIAANLWRNTRETANGRDDDGNGYIDDVNGINATVARNQSGSGTPTDDVGHGSHVAGIIGAVGNNGRGVSGVAWKVQIMPLKFITASGTGSVSDAAECIDYAIANGAKVINASYGALNTGQGPSQTEVAAIQRTRDAGIVFVAAAGNDGLNLDVARTYPANYGIDNIIAVGNTTRLEDIATSSNTGSGSVDLMAPGSEILSLGSTADNAYAVLTGTSMSAPHVTGAIALLRARYPNDTYRQSINRLLRSVDPIAKYSGRTLTGGRLNLRRALEQTDTRPFNDDFAARGRLQGELIQVRGASQGATREAGEPTHGGDAQATLWWTWTAPASSQVSIDTQGSSFDTLLAVYTGATVDGLTLVAANDNAVGQVTSNVSFSAQAGVTYQIAVGGKAGASGLVLMNLGAVPANDNFASAAVLTEQNPIVTAIDTKASSEVGEPAHGGAAARRSLWYKWTAPTSTRYHAAAASTQIYPIVAVYTGTSLSSLQAVAADVSSAGAAETNHAIASFDAIAGTTYQIAVDSAVVGTAELTGQFTFTITDAAWIARTDRDVTSAAAVGADGTVYIGSNDSSLYAFEPLTGAIKWKYTVTPATLIDTGSAAVGTDGTIYFGATDGYVYAVTDQGTSGALRWKTSTGGPITNAVAIAADGTLYIRIERGTTTANAEAQLVALRGSDGTLLWRYNLGTEASYAAPSIAVDGTIYVAGGDSALHAVNPNGQRRWRFAADNQIYTSPAIDDAGNLYVASLSGSIYALNATGTQRWKSSTGGFVTSSIALGNGTGYLASYDHKLYAVDLASGQIRWSYELGDEVRASSPAVAQDGSIFIGGYDKRVHHVNPDGTLRRTYAGADWFRSSVLLAGGRLIVGNNDGRVYALNVNLRAAPAASSPWPQLRHNVRRTARAVTGLDDPVVLGNENGTGRLTNLSVRTRAGTASDALIVGFVVAGGSDGAAKTLLIRGVGPGLLPYGVSGVLADPQLVLRDAAGLSVASNDNWGGSALITSTGRSVGAFDLAVGSLDAALVTSVIQGSFTAQVFAANNTTGVALAEIYDPTATAAINAGASRLVNLSVRARAGLAEEVLIAGFSISDGPRRVLIRGVGPSLGAYGVTDVLADPTLELYSGQTLIKTNNDWGTESLASEAAIRTGAFALAPGSRDAATVMLLPPGGYTVIVRGAGNTQGVALVEVYEVR